MSVQGTSVQGTDRFAVPGSRGGGGGKGGFGARELEKPSRRWARVGRCRGCHPPWLPPKKARKITIPSDRGRNGMPFWTGLGKFYPQLDWRLCLDRVLTVPPRSVVLGDT